MVVDEHDIEMGLARPREGRQLIRREGEYWTIIFAGEVCRLRDATGVRYLAYLLLRPHQRLPAIEIVAGQVVTGPIDDLARERARINVTRSIAAVLKRIDPHHATLVRHLRATLRMGRFCVYEPDPRILASWQSEYE